MLANLKYFHQIRWPEGSVHIYCLRWNSHLYCSNHPHHRIPEQSRKNRRHKIEYQTKKTLRKPKKSRVLVPYQSYLQGNFHIFLRLKLTWFPWTTWGLYRQVERSRREQLVMQTMLELVLVIANLRQLNNKQAAGKNNCSFPKLV